MKLYDFSLAMIIGSIALAVTVGLLSQKYLGDDNAVEELCEEFIYDKTGLEVDLSPKSKETSSSSLHDISQEAKEKCLAPQG